MRFKRPRRTGRGFAVVEVTPLIDVIFLLLIFFVVSTTFVRTSAIEVDLPTAAASARPPPGGIEVRVSEAGSFVVNGQALGGPVRLVPALRQAHAGSADPQPQLVIAADADARHQDVVHVLDAARKVGLTNVRVLTEARSPKPEDEANDG